MTGKTDDTLPPCPLPAGATIGPDLWAAFVPWLFRASIRMTDDLEPRSFGWYFGHLLGTLCAAAFESAHGGGQDTSGFSELIALMDKWAGDRPSGRAGLTVREAVRELSRDPNRN